MTGSIWGDVALGVFVAAIFLWWIVRLVRRVSNARRIVDMTGAQIAAMAAQEAEAERAQRTTAAAQPGGNTGPWERPR